MHEVEEVVGLQVPPSLQLINLHEMCSEGVCVGADADSATLDETTEKVEAK